MTYFGVVLCMIRSPSFVITDFLKVLFRHKQFARPQPGQIT